MFKSNLRKIAILLPVLLAASGCSTMAINEAEDQIENADKKALEKLNQGSKVSPSAVKMFKGNYIAGKAYKLSDKDFLPDFFESKITFHQKDLVSFNEIISNIGVEVGTRVELTPDAIDYIRGLSGGGGGQKDSGGEQPNGEVVSVGVLMDSAGQGLVGSDLLYSLYHDGTVASLMDIITAKANLFWKWENNRISIFRHETKHYTFDGEPTTTKFEAKVASSNKTSDANGGLSSSHGTSFSADNGSIYEDIKQSIDAMVSSDGKFSISKQTGTITVTDTPTVLAKIDNYIEEINDVVNKRLLIKTEVYEVVSDENGDFGIDWDMVWSGSSKYGFDFGSALQEGTTPNMKFGLLPGNGVFSGTQAFISALNKATDYSLVTTSTNYTTNGQPVPVQIANEKHYIKSVTTQTENSGNADSASNTRYQIEPGVVQSGFTMTINPRIDSEGDVAMQFAVDMSQLNSLDERQFGEEGSQFVIQQPDKTSKNFVQRVSVGSGKTIMINGFERAQNDSSTTSIGSKKTWLAGGKRSGGKTKVMTVILVTPYIMSK